MATFNSDKKFTWKKFNNMLAFMKEVVSEHPILFFVATFFCIFDNGIYCFSPYLVNKIVNTLTHGNNSSFLWFGNFDWHGWVFISLGYILFYALIELGFQISLGIMGVKIEVSVRLKCLKRLVENDISFYSNHQIGLLMSRTITDSFNIYNGFYTFMLNFFYIIVGSLVIFATSINLNKLLTLVVFIPYIACIFFSCWVFVYYRRSSIISIEERQNIDRIATDKLLNIRLIKSSGNEKNEIADVVRLNKNYSKLHSKYINWQSLLSGVTTALCWILPFCTTFLSIYIIKGSVEDKTTSIITFLTIDYSIMRIAPFLPATIRSSTKTMNAVLRLNVIIQSKSIIVLKEDCEKIDEISKIEFKDVEFNYPESPNVVVLPKINLLFEKGKKYAFVGETGSGKSSIAKLLLRLYDTSHGQIIFNDKYEIKNLDLANYLQKVGYVEQEPQLVFGNIIENILYGNDNASYNDAIDASKAAMLHNFVETLPQKYETILGERGFILSGGQKQRIIIARTILKKPNLLILDEATSALDNIVEKEIQKSLDEISSGKITVAIAHRLSTVIDYDCIYVLGKTQGIVEFGTSKELLKIKNGIFKKLYENANY